MLLEHKNAIVYGGGGSVGGAVACTFANITCGAILD
jgi:FlaA1/EpsC-like NDP-sugar epimerase